MSDASDAFSFSSNLATASTFALRRNPENECPATELPGGLLEPLEISAALIERQPVFNDRSEKP
jgi:hypothetical protein